MNFQKSQVLKELKEQRFERAINLSEADNAQDIAELSRPINLVVELTWESDSSGEFTEKLTLDTINIFTGKLKTLNFLTLSSKDIPIQKFIYFDNLLLRNIF